MKMHTKSTCVPGVIQRPREGLCAVGPQDGHCTWIGGGASAIWDPKMQTAHLCAHGHRVVEGPPVRAARREHDQEAKGDELRREEADDGQRCTDEKQPADEDGALEQGKDYSGRATGDVRPSVEVRGSAGF